MPRPRLLSLALLASLGLIGLLRLGSPSAAAPDGGRPSGAQDWSEAEDPRAAPARAERPDRAAPDAPGNVDQAAGPIPFDPFPAVTLPTTAGSLSLGAASEASTILVAHSPISVMGEALWAADVDWLFDLSPADTHYAFMSYAESPEAVAADLEPMRQKIEAALAGRPAAERDHWLRQVHYVTVNPMSLGGDFAALLDAWGTVVSTVHARWPGHDLQLSSTPDTGWAGQITAPMTNTLAWFGTACNGEAPAQDVSGRFALIARGTCTFTEKVINAEAQGATAAIIYDDGRGKLAMSGTCNPCPQIPALMIDQAPGLEMRGALEAGETVTATLNPSPVGAELLGQDHAGRVREFGEIPYAFNSFLVQDGQPPVDVMASLAYEAQYFHYENARDSRLRAEEAAGGVTVLPLIEDTWVSDPNWAGQRAYAEIALPGPAEMAQFDTLEVELSLGCEDNRKAKCPIWDYVDNLYLCDADDPNRCDLEVARWITSYDSYGHWVTDISPMLAFLSEGGTRRLAFYNQQPYRVDMAFRLSNRGKSVVPKRAVELLRGGDFYRDYNRRYGTMRFQVPEWAEKVELVALITGHGGRDDEGCGEFCNHTHHFSFNGSIEHVKRHDVVDSANPQGQYNGCKDRVADGVVANQGGTWVYGRAGWCPGLDVPFWTVDITGDVQKGAWNTVDYRGLFKGQDYVSTANGQTDPPPEGGWDARIDMRSYIVYSAAPDVVAGPVPPVEPVAPTPGTPGTPPAETPTAEPTEPPTAEPTGEPTTEPTALPTTAVPPTSVPSPTASRTLVPPASPTPPSAASPSPPPGGAGEVCLGLASRVPAAVIAQAMQNPASINGWNQLCQPNLPPSPWNIQRRRLTVSAESRPYHPLFNGLAWRCGCR